MDCPACGTANVEHARFCLSCGAALLPRGSGAPREERKVVSILFADLVGFTARAESLDPEDVERVLRPYHDRLRTDIERWGGTVEKFIGDAVMAVFGAPIAHEDDAERAVRAALAIRDWAREQDGMELRVAVNTGEALVSLDARPELGQSMVKGDVVNTASRLQSAAPINAVLVGESTYRATATLFEYSAAQPIAAKGKAEPVSAWSPVEARSRFGVDVRRVDRTPLVGRERELDALVTALARALTEREPQLVTVVGVPGIGKSRLVWELFQRVDREQQQYAWRQGRSLPYGEGVSFWALGEMVKAQAGILESDEPEAAASKLVASVDSAIGEVSERDWVAGHLRALVGLGQASAAATANRGEAFAAWRRYLESIAEQHPLILVFEDLHWADDSLLDFVDYLAEWTTGVALLLVGTARPELLTRRPGWGGGKTNALTLSLSPLSDTETTKLVHDLLAVTVMPADYQQALLENAAGNPLYAEEFVRLAREGRSDGHVPETVQAIIAARLDGLDPDDKRVLQQAAVLGKVFWLGGLATVGERPRVAVEDALHRLERREFVRRERSSSVAAETEFVFRHALVRDVAYEQLPRGERADLHLRVARWIESLGRAEDTSEMLAHHYLAALEYARAAGRTVDDIVVGARPILAAAGERALALYSSASAERFFSAALGLMAEDDNRRPYVLLGLGRAQEARADEDAVATLEEASAALAAVGDRDSASTAELLAADACWHSGNRAGTDTHLERAKAFVQDGAETPALAQVTSEIARYHMIQDQNSESIAAGELAIALARRLDLPAIEAHALDTVGTSRFALGDVKGLDDLEQGLEIARGHNSPEEGRALNNLSVSYWVMGDLRRGDELRIQSAAVSHRFGAIGLARFAEAYVIDADFWRGDWDRFLARVEEHVAAGRRFASAYGDAQLDAHVAHVLLARGREDEALAKVRRAADWGRQMDEPQALVPVLADLAFVELAIGLDEAAEATINELVDKVGQSQYSFLLVAPATITSNPRLIDLLRSIVPERHVPSLWTDALADVLDGRHVPAAETLEAMGVRTHAALARTEAAARFAAAGRDAEADTQARLALEFWRSVGATRYVARAERALSKAG